MALEDKVNGLNRRYFFGEMTYSKTKFTPQASSELELADALVVLQDQAIAFQLKERFAPQSPSPDGETKWFEGKVLKSGTKQIRDTRAYLENCSPIRLENRRGHSRNISGQEIRKLHGVVCFEPSSSLPLDRLNYRFHESSTAGIIHVMPAADYDALVATLLTPAEVFDFFAFREALIVQYPDKVRGLTEQALIGQYLSTGDPMVVPSEAHAATIAQLRHAAEQWDVSGILERFAEKITDETRGSDSYYPIWLELAKLKRNELALFKQRFDLTTKNAKEGILVPYRMFVQRTGCGFVFIPIPAEHRDEWEKPLMNLTMGGKYSFRAEKCVGVSIAPDGEPEHLLINWCYIEQEWQEDAVIEEWLRNSPFPPLRTVEIARYHMAQ